MPPVKTIFLIENKSHDLALDATSSYPVRKKRTDDSLLSPPAVLRRERKQQEARASSSSPRTDNVMTGRTKEELSQQNVRASKEKEEKGGGVSMIRKVISRPEAEVAISRNGEDTIVRPRSVLETLEDRDEKEVAFSRAIATHNETPAEEHKETGAGNETDQHNDGGSRKTKAGTKESPRLKQPIKNDATFISIAAYVYKPTKETKTGISIHQRTGEMIKLSKIAKGGLFASSGLKVGDEVISVNNIEIQGLLAKEVVAMIGEMAGSVTILARRKLNKVKKNRPLLPNQKLVDAPNDTPKPKASVLQKISRRNTLLSARYEL